LPFEPLYGLKAFIAATTLINVPRRQAINDPVGFETDGDVGVVDGGRIVVDAFSRFRVGHLGELNFADVEVFVLAGGKGGISCSGTRQEFRRSPVRVESLDDFRYIQRDGMAVDSFELSSPLPAAATECVIEFEDGSGARMRVCLCGGDAPDLVALGRMFRSVE